MKPERKDLLLAYAVLAFTLLIGVILVVLFSLLF